MASKKLDEKKTETTSTSGTTDNTTVMTEDDEFDALMGDADYGLSDTYTDDGMSDVMQEVLAEMNEEESGNSNVTEYVAEEIVLKTYTELDVLPQNVDASQYSVVSPGNTAEENAAAIKAQQGTIGTKQIPGTEGAAQFVNSGQDRKDTAMLQAALDAAGEDAETSDISAEIPELGGTISWASTTVTYEDGTTGYDYTKTGMLHYEGELGSFDYDPNEFEICEITIADNRDATGQLTTQPVLHYIGSEYRGGYINIPEGVTNGDYMFYGNDDLETIPKLPSTLVTGHCMFAYCENAERFSIPAKVGANEGLTWLPGGKAYGYGGEAYMPEGLKDASGMFAGCSSMTESFAVAGNSLMDARGMYLNCTDMEGIMDCGRAFYLAPIMMASMYSGTNVEAIIQNGTAEDGTKLYPNNNYSIYWDRENNRYLDDITKTDNGMSVAKKKEAEAIANKQIMLTTMVGATDATIQTYKDEDGQLHSTTDMSKLSAEPEQTSWLDSITGMFNLEGGAKNLAVAAGELALLKCLSGSWLAAGVGTVVLQKIGTGPILNGIAEVVGKDSDIGKKLVSWADALSVDGSANKEPNVILKSGYDNATEVTDAVMTTKFNDAMDVYLDNGGNIDIQQSMANNGAYAASEDVFLAAAEHSVDELGAINKTMDFSLSALNVDVNAMLAEGDGTLSDENKAMLSNTFIGLVKGIDAYDDAAEAQIGVEYANNKADEQKAARGLQKVLGQMSAPVYDYFMELDKQYGIFDAMTEEQKKELSDVEILGFPKFEEYTVGMDISPEVDPDVIASQSKDGSVIVTTKSAEEIAVNAKSVEETVGVSEDFVGPIQPTEASSEAESTANDETEVVTEVETKAETETESETAVEPAAKPTGNTGKRTHITGNSRMSRRDRKRMDDLTQGMDEAGKKRMQDAYNVFGSKMFDMLPDSVADMDYGE